MAIEDEGGLGPGRVEPPQGGGGSGREDTVEPLDPETIARALARVVARAQAALQETHTGSPDPETATRLIHQTQANAEVIARALAAANSLEHEAISRAINASTNLDQEAIARAIQRQIAAANARRELVSESALEDDVDDPIEPVDDTATQEIPDELRKVAAALEAQGFSPEFRESPSGITFAVAFDLPAGRSTRTVYISSDAAPLLLDSDISGWRSLQKYDGIWHSDQGMIECALRRERLGPPLGFTLRQLGRLASGNQTSLDMDNPPPFELSDERTGVRARIGVASDLAAVLLSPGRSRAVRRGLTLRLSGVVVGTTEAADDVVERVANALTMDLDIAAGITLSPQRLENREIVHRRKRQHGQPVQFPRNQYPHAPVLLYRAGRDPSTSPLIRYWSFYQVLEYFFPRYSHAEAMKQLARHLRSPAFDAHRDEHVLRAIELAAGTARGAASEEEQLLLTLRAIVLPEEVISHLRDAGVDEHVAASTELTKCKLTLQAAPELLTDLAKRIYDVRCRIVHSKSISQRESGPGLLPGTHHDDLVRNELPLMEYLAQQALINAAEPLALPIRTPLTE